jgi:hypothetical protein
MMMPPSHEQHEISILGYLGRTRLDAGPSAVPITSFTSPLRRNVVSKLLADNPLPKDDAVAEGLQPSRAASRAEIVLLFINK